MTNRGIARAGLVVTAAFLASRLLGWVRLVVIGNVFGKDPDLAAYFTAFRIPDLIYQLVAAGAIASALIPVLAALLADGTPSRAWRVASTVGNLILVALLVLATIVLIWAPELVPFLFPGQDAHATEVTVQLTRIMVLAPIFLALGAVASAILNTQGRFGVAAMGPVMFNLAIIVFAFVLGPTMGIQALAIGTVVGAFLHFAIQVPLVRRLFTYHPRIDLRDEAARKALWLMVPRAIGLGITQITFLVNISLATVTRPGIGGRLHGRLHHPPDPAGPGRLPARRGAAAVAVAGHGRGSHGGLRAADGALHPAGPVADARAEHRGHRHGDTRPSPCCSAAAASRPRPWR